MNRILLRQAAEKGFLETPCKVCKQKFVIRRSGKQCLNCLALHE